MNSTNSTNPEIRLRETVLKWVGGVGLALLVVGVPVAQAETEAPDLEERRFEALPLDPARDLEVQVAPEGSLLEGFDGKLAQVTAAAEEGPGVGAAGKVVERFAPPVASGAGASAFAAGTDGRGALSVNALRPCDDPGAACRNLGGPRSATVPINPPIIAGGRPTPVGGAE